MKIQISLLVVLMIFCAGCSPVTTPTVPPTTITPVLVTPTSAPTDVPLPRQIYLSELPPFFSQVGAWAFSRGVFPASEAAIVKGGIIQSAGKEYPQGLFAHAYSWLDFELDGQYQTFNSDILIQDSADCSDGANFYVFVDGEEAYRQMGMLPGDAPRSIEVDVRGGMHLWLIADSASGNNNCDWTIWGDPMLTTTLSQPSQLLSDSKGLERWLEEYVNAYGGQIDGKDAAAWKASILNDPQHFTRQKTLGGQNICFHLGPGCAFGIPARRWSVGAVDPAHIGRSDPHSDRYKSWHHLSN